MHTKTITILSAILWAALSLQVFALDDKEEAAVEHDESSLPTKKAAFAKESIQQRYKSLLEKETTDSNDDVMDGMLLPFSQDYDCDSNSDCDVPPESTIETTTVQQEVCDAEEETCSLQEDEVDKHWGYDMRVLAMRDRLRKAGSGVYDDTTTDTTDTPAAATTEEEEGGEASKEGGAEEQEEQKKQRQTQQHPFDANKRPPIFLMPGLAATRLVSWKHKACHSAFLSDIKFQDYVWLNMKLLVQMGAIAVQCWSDCMTLGLNQTDSNLGNDGCKLRPDEGLDAIASLAPGSVGAELLVGHTNTVFAWLVQWLADNLGYDLSNIIGLPYDWRLSPHMMEKRDGFLSSTRRRIEAAVRANGGLPGIIVAHSMGNAVFRYFLIWLRQEMRHEAYEEIVKRAERRAKRQQQVAPQQQGGWLSGVTSGLDELWQSYFAEEPPPPDASDAPADKHWQFWELAKHEGDERYMEWMEKHLWTYVGLSAPLLGAVNPLRSVISGENMGLPFSDEMARQLELSFGCTNTVNPISSKMAFCDNWENGELGDEGAPPKSNLFCLDALVREIEESTHEQDPWTNFPQLEKLLKKRVDWDTDTPMITIVDETECDDTGDTNRDCEKRTHLGPRDAQTGELFRAFSRTWKEEHKEMDVKREQMEDSFWHSEVPNMLNKTWDRPYIKHIIMAYGVDTPTEIGYEYRKKRKDPKAKKKGSTNPEFDGIPTLSKVLWESQQGVLEEEVIDAVRGSLTDALIKKKPKHETIQNGTLLHSGDGTIPYVSLSWAHTWLLHAIRAQRFTEGKMEGGNMLDTVQVSHRPENELAWKPGRPPEQISLNKNRKPDPDTGTSHPHGTRYKPEMVKFHNVGTSRSTGMTYSTTVIEAAGVEHKETTRNYDILAAAFSEVLLHMRDDFGLV